MNITSITILAAVSLMLSACMLTGGDKKETAAAASAKPTLTQAAAKTGATAGTEHCDDKGFCALPGLKKYQKAE